MVTVPRSRVNTLGMPGPRGATGPAGPAGPSLRYVISIENFLEDAAGDIRTATRAAFQSDLTTAGVTFKFPAGVYTWVGAALDLADGFRNNCTYDFTGCELTRDIAGVAGGTNFFFTRTQEDATHADGLRIIGGKFSLLNCLTSFFGMAFYIQSASNCLCDGSEFYCTLDPAAVTGRIRWGLGFFGGSVSNGGGRNNAVRNLKLTRSQVQLCGQGCDADGIVAENIISFSSNDFAVSCVSSGDGGCSLRNVRISGVTGHNVTGTGLVFVGNDGVGGVTALVNVENILIEDIQLGGSDDFALSFPFGHAVLFDGGAVTRNVQIRGVNTTFTSSASQARSVVVNGHPDATSWTGLVLADMNLGTVTDNDPLEALYVGGTCVIQQVSISNINVLGERGVFVSNCENLNIVGLTTLNGTLTVRADHHLGPIAITNCSFARGSGFNGGVVFTSPSGFNFTNVSMTSVTAQGHSNPGIVTSLNGGTMAMHLCNVQNLSDALNAETLAGIVSSVGSAGVSLDRASFGSGKGYVDAVIDLGAQVAGAVSEISTTVSGSLVGDVFAITSLTALDSTIIIAPGRCRVAGTVVWRIFNASGTPDPASNTFRFSLVSRN